MMLDFNIQKQLQESWISQKREEGLFPKSGNWYFPERWVTREDFIASQPDKEWAQLYVDTWESGEGKVHDWQKPDSPAREEQSRQQIQIADQEYSERMTQHQNILTQEIEGEDSQYRKDILEKQESNLETFIDRLNDLPDNLQDIVTTAHEEYRTIDDLVNGISYKIGELKSLSEVMSMNVDNFSDEARDKAEFNSDLIRFAYMRELYEEFEYLDEEEFDHDIDALDNLRHYLFVTSNALDDLDSFMYSYEEATTMRDSNFFYTLYDGIKNSRAYGEGILESYDSLQIFLEYTKTTDEKYSGNEPKLERQANTFSEHPKIVNDNYTETQSLKYHRDSDKTNHDIPINNMKALMAYQGGPHDIINMFLHFHGDRVLENDDIMNKQIVQTVRAIDSAFLTGGKTNDTNNTMVLYRGVSTGQYKDIFEAQKSDGTYVNKSYISTSDSFISAKSFGRLIEIHIPPESIPFIDMNETLWASDFTGEKEILLPRDIEFDLVFDENRQRIIMKANGLKENSTANKSTYYGIDNEDNMNTIAGDFDEGDTDSLLEDINNAEKKAFGEVTPSGQDSINIIKILFNEDELYEEDLIEMAENSIQDTRVKNRVLEYLSTGTIEKSMDTMSINISGVAFEVLVPYNPIIGLGHLPSMNWNTGMIFYAPPKNYDKESVLFTMDNMQFPLDFICIDSNDIIIHIERDVAPYPHNLVELPLDTAIVFEVNAGASKHCNIGDVVSGISPVQSIIKGMIKKSAVINTPIVDILKQLAPDWIQQKQNEGLYPKSGNWYYPYRWVTKEDFINESNNPEQAEQMIDAMDSYMSGSVDLSGIRDSEEYKNNEHFANILEDFNIEILYIDDLMNVSYSELSNLLIPTASKMLWTDANNEVMKNNFGILNIMQIFHEDSPYQYGMPVNEQELLSKYYFMPQKEAYKELIDNKKYLEKLHGYVNSVMGDVVDNTKNNKELEEGYKKMALNSLNNINNNLKSNSFVMQELGMYSEEFASPSSHTKGLIIRNKNDDEADTRDLYKRSYDPNVYYALSFSKGDIDIPPLTTGAIYHYQIDSININSSVFNDSNFAYEEPNSELSQDIQSIDTAIAMSPLNKESMTLWRGINNSDVWNHIVDAHKQGMSEYTNKPFMSTSLNFATAKSFEGGLGGMIKIHVPDNATKLLPLDEALPTSGFNEREYLLPRESKFNIEWNDDGEYFDFYLIPENGIGITEDSIPNVNVGLNNLYGSLQQYDNEDMHNLIKKTEEAKESLGNSWPKLTRELDESLQAIEMIEYIQKYKKILSENYISDESKKRSDYFREMVYETLGNIHSSNIIEAVHKEIEYMRTGVIQKEFSNIFKAPDNATPEPEKGSYGAKSESDKFRELGEKGVLNWFLIQGITQQEYEAYQEERIKRDNIKTKKKKSKNKIIEDLYVNE